MDRAPAGRERMREQGDNGFLRPDWGSSVLCGLTGGWRHQLISVSPSGRNLWVMLSPGLVASR